MWLHAKCEHLSSKDVNVLAKANHGYICLSCTHDNSDMSLARINEVSVKMVLLFSQIFFLLLYGFQESLP